MKKCIFYLPYKLDEHGNGARMLRPRKMIQAFRDLGYDVFVIEGFSDRRRELIHEVKTRISSGEKYDFMYAESHTMPMLLTDPHHFPTHPFLDFSFFRYVRQHGIHIGLFYCDIYWKFDTYGTELPAWKRNAALANYRYDITQYKKYLNKFYVPDLKVCEYLKENKLAEIASELPPGAEDLKIEGKDYTQRDFQKEPLSIFYVGGLGNQYQILELVKAVPQVSSCQLTICCRESEWEREKTLFSPYLCERIEIIHKSGDQLEEYYQRADLCSLLFKPDIYREMAKPFKAYEYLAHEIPILATKGTAIGQFVEENGIGWNIPFGDAAIIDTLNWIMKNPHDYLLKKKNCNITKYNNLWKERASKVARDLTI